MTKRSLRNILDITLSEAIQVLKITKPTSEIQNKKDYKLTPETFGSHKGADKLVVLSHTYLNDNIRDVIFNERGGVSVCENNRHMLFFIDYYRIIKYLEKKGFDLEDINKKDENKWNI